MLGIKAAVFITNHDNPLGRAIGNQIEIEETVECLHGNVPSDLHELITKFGRCQIKLNLELRRKYTYIYQFVA